MLTPRHVFITERCKFVLFFCCMLFTIYVNCGAIFAFYVADNNVAFSEGCQVTFSERALHSGNHALSVCNFCY